jgi:small subunit ribosomal protein S21
MNGIIIKDDEPFEKAMRRFIKTCEKSGVLLEVRNLRCYEKPSEERKRKKNTAQQKAKRGLILLQKDPKRKPKKSW